MYQAASRALLHGADIYGTHWNSGMPGQVVNGFSYLPGSAVLLAPFNWLFGDVRYGLIAATAVAAWVAFRLNKGPHAWILASMVLVFPKSTYGIVQSWNDPLLLGLVIVFVALVVSHRRNLALLAFIAVLASKQYGWFLIPMAAVWPAFGWRRTGTAIAGAIAFTLPWALVDLGQFWHSVVTYPLHVPPRWDSLSLYSLGLRHGLHPSVAILGAATLLAILLSLVVLPRDAFGFSAGAAVVLSTFMLFDKLAFYNEWWLVSGLVVLTAIFPPGDYEGSTLVDRLQRLGTAPYRPRHPSVQSATAPPHAVPTSK
jgi:hypothetical protein